MSKWFRTIAVAAGLGLLLGSCSSYSGYVSDHWPHWAGGEPDDLPPRPGQPGYDEFVAHKGTTTQAASTNAANGQTAQAGSPPAPAQPTTPAAPANNAAPQAAPRGAAPPTAQADRNVGGLY
jgi:hypothetical protein